MSKRIFQAQYRGSFLPDNSWEGSVQSVYSKALNLLHPSGVLISIVNSPVQMTDYGLVIAGFDPSGVCINPGTHFLWEKELLLLPNMVVDLSGATVWSGSFLYGKTELSMKKIEQIKKIYMESAPEEGFSPLITGRPGNIYSKAAFKIINMEPGRAFEAERGVDFSHLIGMGIGFTPSGDDFLTGIMFYEQLSGMELVERGSVAGDLERTTIGGRTLLDLALKNSYPAYLIRFGELFTSSVNSVKDEVMRVLDHGSTSGSDSLAGFIWAAENFEKLTRNNLT